MEEQEKKHQFLLTQLVMIFHAAAMQQLGKVKNPLTDKIERDLAAAQHSIDLLDMLREKMKGNLTTDEARLLKEVVMELKLNYVDEMKKSAPEETHKEGEKTGP